MATKKAKPNGQFHLLPESVEDYFNDIPISDLPGVGYSTNFKLKNLNMLTCSDLRSLSLVRLQQEFGKKLGESLYNHCRGIDDKQLNYDQIRKSVSAEVNYGIRFTEMHELDAFLCQLCTEVHHRLEELGSKGRTITLKYMVRAAEAPVETAKFMGHGFCDNVTRSTTLSSATDDPSTITSTVLAIKSALNVPPKELRGIGIQISKLEASAAAEPKSNTLKQMFDKVIEKNKQSEMTNIPTNEFIEVKKVPNLRKTKSFDTSSNRRDIGDMFALMQSKADIEDGNLMDGIDLAVLADLPIEIREEILRDQKVLRENLGVDRRGMENRRPTARKIEDEFKNGGQTTSAKIPKVSLSISFCGNL